MVLLVISDTPLYHNLGKQRLEVFEPTLREVESLCFLFKSVRWLGYDFRKPNPGHARAPLNEKIVLQVLPTALGGKGIINKLKIIPFLPFLIKDIYSAIRDADVVHTRGPSVPAFLGIILSFILGKKIYWHKYAGNWIEPSPPFMYALQKRLLIRARHSRVTINGRWPDQPAHVISLENPCFTRAEWEAARADGRIKHFSSELVLCFSGLVAESKGVPQMLRALRCLKLTNRTIKKIVIAGRGPDLELARSIARVLPVPVEFKGYLKRGQLNDVYRESHVLLLPSRTEGFPKVVAEAASFGCIPVVTNVSSIGQYVINGENGFLLEDNQERTISRVLEKLLSEDDLKAISEKALEMSERFTYERFVAAIQRTVLNRS